jgi:hypothetical protein
MLNTAVCEVTARLLKVKGHTSHAMQALWESRLMDVAQITLNVGARLGWAVNATPRPLYPWKQPRWLGRRAFLDGCEEDKFFFPAWFEPRTFRPVASCYIF